MKKIILSIISLMLVIALTGCKPEATTDQTPEETEEYVSEAATDYPAAIMVDDTIYLLSGGAMPVEVDESAIIGYTTAYTDTFPEKNGETNFNRELDMPYAKVENGIAVLYENEWHLCTPKG